MGLQYHLKEENLVNGPFGADEIRNKLFRGEIGVETLIGASDPGESPHWDSFVPFRKSRIFRRIIIATTEASFPVDAGKRIGIVSSECCFGINLFGDMIIGLRDITGGRSRTTQSILRDAHEKALAELRIEAFEAGANAVVAVRFSYNEFGKKMIFVVAYGTAFKFNDEWYSKMT